MRQAWIHDTITGAPILPVYPKGGRWTTRVTGAETASLSFNLRDDFMGQLPQPVIADLFRVRARSLRISDGDAVEFAGPIMTVRDDPLSGDVEVACKGIRTLAAERSTFPVNNIAAGDLTISSRSHTGAVRAILTRFMYWSSEWALPIDLPADGSGVYSRAVKGWEAQTIERLLQSVEAEGAEVWFRPYLAGDGSLRYQTRVASKITIGTFTDVMSAAFESPLTKLERSSDGSRMATGVITLGRGSERDTKSSWAGYLAGPAIPVADLVLTKKDIPDVEALTRISAAELVDRRSPGVQWSMELTTEKIAAARVLPGSLVRLDVRNDRLHPDGQYSLRVVSLSGSWGSSRVQPEVQAYG